MWRKTDEAKASSAEANATAPAATISNVNQAVTLPATPAADASAFSVPPAAPAVSASSAADLAAAVASVATISAGLKIRGDITGNCHLVVEGEVQGKIHMANGRVTVGPSGRVHADIDAPEIAIDGNVQGNLQARDSVRLGPASHVQGSVRTPRIRIEDGARLRGKVEMIRPGEAIAPSADAAGSSSAEPPKAAAAGGPRT